MAIANRIIAHREEPALFHLRFFNSERVRARQSLQSPDNSISGPAFATLGLALTAAQCLPPDTPWRIDGRRATWAWSQSYIALLQQVARYPSSSACYQSRLLQLALKSFSVQPFFRHGQLSLYCLPNLDVSRELGDLSTAVVCVVEFEGAWLGTFSPAEFIAKTGALSRARFSDLSWRRHFVEVCAGLTQRHPLAIFREHMFEGLMLLRSQLCYATELGRCTGAYWRASSRSGKALVGLVAAGDSKLLRAISQANRRALPASHLDAFIGTTGHLAGCSQKFEHLLAAATRYGGGRVDRELRQMTEVLLPAIGSTCDCALVRLNLDLYYDRVRDVRALARSEAYLLCVSGYQDITYGNVERAFLDGALLATDAATARKLVNGSLLPWAIFDGSGKLLERGNQD